MHLATNPTPEEVYTQADHLLEHGLEEQCEQLLTEAINCNILSANICCCRADVRYGQKRYQEAMADYQMALQLDPNHVASAVNLGNTYCALHQAEQGLLQYAYARKMGEDSALLDTNTGNALMDLKRFSEALDAFSQAIEQDPMFPPPYLNRGNCLALLGRYQEAMADYDQAMLLEPEDSNVVWTVAWAKMTATSKREKMASTMDRIAQLDPCHYTSHMCLAVAAYCRDDMDTARMQGTLALQLEPEQWDPYFWLGFFAAVAGSHDMAIQFIEKALELNLPPFLLTPLYWLESKSPAFFAGYACELLQRYHVQPIWRS